VQQVQVHIIRAQTLEARGAGSQCLFLLSVARQYFAHEKDVVAPALDGLANEALRRAIAIHLRRVDYRHVEVESEAQRGDLVRAPAHGLAHAPRSEPEGGNHVARSKGDSLLLSGY
jgi:hypothetical protein